MKVMKADRINLQAGKGSEADQIPFGSKPTNARPILIDTVGDMANYKLGLDQSGVPTFRRVGGTLHRSEVQPFEVHLT